MRKVRSSLTYANVMATLAFFIAVAGGTAYAANTIFSSDIVNGEVKSVDIGTGEVKSADLSEDSVNGAKLRDNSTGTLHVIDNTLRSVDVLDNNLTAADLATGSVGTDEIADQTVTGTTSRARRFGDDGFNGDAGDPRRDDRRVRHRQRPDRCEPHHRRIADRRRHVERVRRRLRQRR